MSQPARANAAPARRELLLAMRYLVWMTLTGLIVGGSAATADEPAIIDYARQIQPIFARHCLRCHGPKKEESHFRVDRRSSLIKGGDFGAAAIVPGSSDQSPLVEFISGGGDVTMPPEGEPLAPHEVRLIRAWIDQGAKGMPEDDDAADAASDHWAFRSVAASPQPHSTHPTTRNAVDALLWAKLEPAGLAPAPATDRRTLIRRLTLVVLGLPPTPEEVDAFVHDPDPLAYEKLVDRVLASPRFGERWATHWLDVVRFAETNGFEMNQERPTSFHYRDWVIRAFNDDKPYDRFVFEQIAGDSVGEDAATGFLVAGPWDQVKSPDPGLTMMQRQDELADMINVTGGAFLGLTLGCARCHNHKFDPVPQRDYYALAAVFAGVQHGERPLRSTTDPREQAAIDLQSAELARIQKELDDLDRRLSDHAAPRTIVLDDELGPAFRHGDASVEVLAKPAGHGVNPAGTKRGERDDRGDVERTPNWSGGRYTWWHDVPEMDVIAYRPAVQGRYRIWLSWGAGWDTHAIDARYLLDRDGDLATRADQNVLATIDQRQLAGAPGAIPNQPLWSGLAFAGIADFAPASAIVLRAGSSDRPVTADAIVLEESPSDDSAASPAPPLLLPPVDATRTIERITPTLARFVRFTVFATNDGAEPCLDELEAFTTPSPGAMPLNVALASAGAKATSSGDYPNNPLHKLDHVHDGRFGNPRSWIANERGRGWVQIELAQPTAIDRIVWGRDRDGQFRDRLPVRYVIEVSTTGDDWRTVASSIFRAPAGTPGGDRPLVHLARLEPSERDRALELSRRREELSHALAQRQSLPAAYVGKFEAVGETRRLQRGDPMAPREPVGPDAISAFVPRLGSLGLAADAPERERRVRLAKWIARADHPLTARVMANRVWQATFGAGIVATPSDFGRMGAAPTHPELLDWLADRLARDGWSIKRLQRLLLLSHAFQQSSAPSERGLAVDAQCRLLWRFPPRRLEAEAIRDCVLATSAALDLSMHGPGFSAFEPNANYVRVYQPKSTWGPAEWRRMVYMTKVRMQRDGVFGAFDCPDAGLPTPRRDRSTTALQALSLLNSEFTLQQAGLFAERVERDAGNDRRRQVERAFSLAFARAPTAVEANDALLLVESHGLSSLCRALVNANEFLFVP